MGLYTALSVLVIGGFVTVPLSPEPSHRLSRYERGGFTDYARQDGGGRS